MNKKILMRIFIPVFFLLLIFSQIHSGNIEYHKIALKIFVPFKPELQNVLYKDDELFVIALPTPDKSKHVPGIGYARVTPFGDKIVFRIGLNEIGFQSIYLNDFKKIKIPGTDNEGNKIYVPSIRTQNWDIDLHLRKLCFSAKIGKNEIEEILLMDLGKGMIKRLTHSLPRKYGGYSHSIEPHISKDGVFVIFRGIDADPNYIGFIKTDGSGFRKLDEGYIPRGGMSVIALSEKSVFYLKGNQIWKVNLNGTERTQIIREKGEIKSIATDGSGEIIAYVVDKYPEDILKIVNLNTNNLLMDLNIKSWEPWHKLMVSEDGRKVVFNGSYKGEKGVYIINLEEKKVIKIDKGLERFSEHYDPDHTYPDLCATGEIVLFNGGPSGIALAFLSDKSTPDIFIKSPNNESTITEFTPVIEIVYRDKCVVSGINKNSLKVFLNGKDISSLFEIEDERASGKLKEEYLREGENILQTVIYDRAGNKSSCKIIFKLKPWVTYKIQGGIAGFSEEVRLYSDGWFKLKRKNRKIKIFRLSKKQLIEIKKKFEKISKLTLKKEYLPEKPIADDVYEILETIKNGKSIKIRASRRVSSVPKELLSFLDIMKKFIFQEKSQ
ncbi:hypothetical protein NLD30_09015 [SCandidatus Aminicenantes bacterium Aminicenantia_JdfR_composite]|nr:hypothetical protein [SCandidatus Aminicenantes bacterium Aminicenantia_JdfR_composite]MCP2620760.1 hypothetical protein [Candidatus Aminicenantes bacterium AC-334-E05]